MLLVSLFIENWNLLRKSNFSLLAETELAHFGLSPTEKLVISSDSKREIGASFYISNWSAIESLDVLRSRCYLNTLGDTKLAFKSTTPSVDI